ncbi:MAG: NAD(P)-binding domain-containing protein [Pseudonocardiaceae bacterium]
MNAPVDVAVVGAGPYGLSLGAHLRAAGVRYRQFGRPMQPWRDAMPRGMVLTSQGSASNLWEPGGAHTLAAFCAATGRDDPDGRPVPLETFVGYGIWFQQRQVPELEELMVTAITHSGPNDPGGHYELTLSDGAHALAHNVVVATGMTRFAHTPSLLATLPSQVCTHTCAHPDLGVFRGAEVTVVGAGQSALESAALLHEQGTRVTVLARTSRLVWHSDPRQAQRSPLRWLREPAAPLGSGWGPWFYSTRPDLFRLLPADRRVRAARTALGGAGAHWLRSRVEGKFPVLLRHVVRWAEPEPRGVRLGLQVNGKQIKEITADHVLAATGYRAELSRLSFLDRTLRSAVRTLAGSPHVGPDFQSSVPGLYFIGPAVAPIFGPVMRFVYGAGHAVRAVTHSVTTSRRPRVTVGVRR